MKAMLFAAGTGSRLGDLTQTIPKALVPVAGRPIIAHVIERLKAAGITGICVNLFHFADQIKAYLESNQNFGLDVFFSEEQELLDTGGGLLKAKNYFQGEKTILVHNVDIYSDIDLSSIYKAQQQAPANQIATLLVRKKASGRVLLFDEQGLNGWQNTNNGQIDVVRLDSLNKIYGFCGIQAISTKLFDHAPEGDNKFSIIKMYMNAASSNQIISPYHLNQASWFDMGSPDKLAALENFLKTH